MKNLTSVLATAAFILAASLAHGAAPVAAAPTPVCTVKRTISTDDAGRTIIRTKTVCVISLEVK